MQWLRSLIFTAGMVLSTLLLMPLIPILTLVPFATRYLILSQWSRFNLWTLKVICKLDYVVEGREHIPAEASVVLAKHQSAWETLALQQVLPIQTWVLKRELLWIPFFGWGLAMTRPVAIDRKAGKKALRQVIDQGTDRLQHGQWVVVFPEGTRVPPGSKGNYQIGGAMLAVKSGRAVLPIAHNAGEFWPRNGLLKRPGCIHMIVGPTIQTTGRSAAEVNREAEAWIEQSMQRLAVHD